MKRWFCLFFLCLFSNVFLFSTDLECPNRFHIQQDATQRIFRVLDGTKCLATILSSEYGVLDFYDGNQEKAWVNWFDALYDKHDNCVGVLKFASETETFWDRKYFLVPSSLIEIFSPQEELLLTVKAEGGGKCFVFRDPETQAPLAMALWSSIPSGAHGRAWHSQYVQDWEVIITDPTRLQEKKISPLLLVWTLLKYSQEHFPSPKDVPYQTSLPKEETVPWQH